MRGEYKVPGGKLVVVELDSEGGHFRNAHISGDFFLEPDEALADIEGALNGLAHNSSAQEIATAVRAAIGDDVVMLGFSPEAIGTAVRRAVSHARSFEEFEWELVTAPPLSPAMHLALDQVLTEELGAGRRGPTLRIWDWAEPAIILGSFQSLANEVDMPNAIARKVRCTAGFPVAAPCLSKWAAESPTRSMHPPNWCRACRLPTRMRSSTTG